MLASFCKSKHFFSQTGITSTNHVHDEPTVQIYFPSDIRAAGIKDVVRSFIREAKMVCCLSLFCLVFFFFINSPANALIRCGGDLPYFCACEIWRWNERVINLSVQALAIVVECFSDVELLCDILVACRKRNVSVHLLLDHSNLNQFVDMWQELKLDGKNFPVSSWNLCPINVFQPNESKQK